ncbi:MAG: asparagine synthase (glutamine-hydrolyzing) [Phycisphaerales bacterium]|jgi:asparagine synthase (glutamine-hydrolysing)
MCGLAGFAKADLAADDAQALLKRLAGGLVHRGPDGEGTLWHADDRVGLAHRRLSVIDTSAAGAQPMESASGRLAIVFNGEIVNAPELAAELRGAGAIFRGHSDTEVLLEAIEAWGLERSLERIAGMFAFAVHDRLAHTLHLVRDRLGVKPMHYAWIGGEGTRTLAFASELRAILEMPGARREIDSDALAGYMARGCVVGARTIWRGVHKLGPGEWLRLDLASGSTRTLRYWDAAAVAVRGCEDPLQDNDGDVLARGEALLSQVVHENLLSDVPVACFLSGGVDSLSVCALAHAAKGGGNLRAFTLGFQDPAFDERPDAQRAARAIGLGWSEDQISESDMLALVPELAEIYDEPFSDASQIPSVHLCRTMRKNAVVALSGEGGDEVFGGYNRHVHSMLRWNVGAAPGGWLPGLLARGLLHLSRDATESLARSMALVLPALRNLRNPADTVRKWAWMHAPHEEATAYEGLTRVDPFGASGPGWWSEIAARMLPDTLRRMQFMDQTGYMVDDPLVKVDRASMSCGLEVRVPLLDHRVVEFAWRLPPHMKVRDGRGKWLLRALLQRRLPNFEPSRRKVGFAVPLAQWLRGPLRDWAGDMIGQARRASSLLDAAALERDFEAIRAGLDQPAHGVWCGLMLQAWRNRWGASE